MAWQRRHQDRLQRAELRLLEQQAMVAQRQHLRLHMILPQLPQLLTAQRHGSLAVHSRRRRRSPGIRR
jgi:hypothetical protein